MSDGKGYRRVHMSLTRLRGSARVLNCVDCQKPAHSWSYDHTDPDELRDDLGRFYSLDLLRYQPRCGSCHLEFDREFRRDQARGLETDIRFAVAQRERARRKRDRKSEDFWDNELDRLMKPLLRKDFQNAE